MSDIISLLPDAVANQIAAGEVIQRPASVVKELVENALDADATEIHVVIKEAGREAVQVIDNGKGMSITDARLAFERHATSKIKAANDLFALRTMGFRGEALASIAAVAQVELRTRRPEDEVGTMLCLAGSKVTHQEPISCPSGSNFTVNNLFFNVPVRRKFLKSNQTELSNILTEYERIVLVHPEVGFSIRHNDVVLSTLAVTNHRGRILDVFGTKLGDQLLPLKVDTSLVKIHGFVARPDCSRKKGTHQYFFVNGRFMRHPYFHKAVMDPFEQLIPTGEQVSYFIYFEVDPANIDVNIHPTKTEIKFENENAIWQILAATVKETLGKHNAVPSIDFDTEGMPTFPAYGQCKVGTHDFAALAPTDYNPFNTTPHFDTHRQSPPADWQRLYAGVAHGGNEPLLPSTEAEETTLFGDEAQKLSYASHHHQYKGQYILTAAKSGLMIIDQHRAHIRVLYDKYLSQIEQQKGASQGLLFPEMITFPPSQIVIFESLMTHLHSLGFELTSLGGGSYAINGIPSGTEKLHAITLLRNIVQNAMVKSVDVKRDVQQVIALTLAKSTAIVQGQLLSAEEMNSLIDALFQSKEPGYTPDGNTVIAIIPNGDIDKLFK